MTKILLTRRRAELRYDKDVSVSFSSFFFGGGVVILLPCITYYLFFWWRWEGGLLVVGCCGVRSFFSYGFYAMGPSKGEIEMTQMTRGNSLLHTSALLTVYWRKLLT